VDPLARNQPREVQITSSEVIIGRGAACEFRVSKSLTWVSNQHFTVGCAHTHPSKPAHRSLRSSAAAARYPGRDALCDTAPPPRHRRDAMRHVYIKDHSSNGTYVRPQLAPQPSLLP
jgi:hypothetical protein